MSNHITVQCPRCEAHEFELGVYYEPADREVGIMNGGYVFDDGVPEQCGEPECAAAGPYTEDELAMLQKDIDNRVESKAGDELDAYWDSQADAYFDRMRDGDL